MILVLGCLLCLFVFARGNGRPTFRAADTAPPHTHHIVSSLYVYIELVERLRHMTAYF